MRKEETGEVLAALFWVALALAMFAFLVGLRLTESSEEPEIPLRVLYSWEIGTAFLGVAGGVLLARIAWAMLRLRKVLRSKKSCPPGESAAE